jgi:anti-sigma factor RsiW
MPIKHVTKQIEAYLDNRLSAEERYRLEEHVAVCPTCAYRLFTAQRLTNELMPLLKKALGHPTPPPALREQVRKQIIAEHESRRFVFPWAMSGRIINAVGTLAVVGVLAAGALTVFQTQSTSQLARESTISLASAA